VNQVRHNAILAHGLAVQAIRANAPAGTLVGLAENCTPVSPVMETPEHIEAAQKAFRDLNAHFLVTILDGKYPSSYLEREGANAPKIAPGDMEAIGSRLDFVGLNCYTGGYARADGSKQGYAMVPQPSSYPHMLSSWINICPESMYWGVRTICELWPKLAPGIYITENGCSSADAPTAEGRIDVSAHLSDAAASRRGRGLSGEGLLSLEFDG
jgi:beta-glucosidase